MGNRSWPALVVQDPGGAALLLALDDFHPTALEEHDGGHVRVFFADTRQRDEALAGLPLAFRAQPIDVSDEDWARRSQQQLTPVAVGRLIICPTPDHLGAFHAGSPGPDSIPLLIPPSMGFGTGHHATTRMCLAALQAIDLSNRTVLDVGTGSGVLALAAQRLGARSALGIDSDPDAIQAAEENRLLNEPAPGVRFAVADFRTAPDASATDALVDVISANLTGSMLTAFGSIILQRLHVGGVLIISGVQRHERNGVFGALAAAQPFWEAEEDGWIGAAFTRGEPAAV